MKNKILFTCVAVGSLVFALVPFVTSNNNVVVNAQLNDNISYMPNVTLNTNFFTNIGDNEYEFNYSRYDTIYLQPKFNYLDKDLLNYFDSTFSIGYFESATDGDFYGELIFDIDNNIITFLESENVYFYDGIWSLNNNVIWTDSENSFTENVAKFIQANFNLSRSNNFNNTTSTNLLLTTNQPYYFNNDFLEDNPYSIVLNGFLNVGGKFYDGTIFNRLQVDGTELYVLVNGTYININDYDYYNYFVLNVVDVTPINNGSASFINRTLTRVDTLPYKIGGWFTFNEQPFNNTTDYFTFNRDIYFTSNNISYNNILVTYDNILNSQVASIYYRIKEANGTYSRSDLIYSYQAVPYITKWENINNRQIYFDNFIITPQEYDFMRSIGTFTFISNNNSNSVVYTLTDLFWGVADIPYVTLRNLLGIELFGSNLFIAFTSVISVILAIFILRKIV